MIDYSISTIKNDLNKEKIAVKGCFSEFRNGDIHVDGDKISALLLYLEDEKIERVFIFVSSDRAQQWVTAIIGKQSERLPESSAAVIDTAFPNMVRYYGLQLELLKSQRDESHQQFEDAMKALNLIKRKL